MKESLKRIYQTPAAGLHEEKRPRRPDLKKVFRNWSGDATYMALIGVMMLTTIMGSPADDGHTLDAREVPKTLVSPEQGPLDQGEKDITVLPPSPDVDII